MVTAENFKRLRDNVFRLARRFDSCFDDADRSCKSDFVVYKCQIDYPHRQIEAQTPNEVIFPPSTRYEIDVLFKAIFCLKLPSLKKFYKRKLEPIWHQRPKSSAKGNFG